MSIPLLRKLLMKEAVKDTAGSSGIMSINKNIVDKVEFSEGKFDVYMNVDANIADLTTIKQRLVDQIDNSVLFYDQILNIENNVNPEKWYHIGPGNVTAGMVKKSISSKGIEIINSLDSLNTI